MKFFQKLLLFVSALVCRSGSGKVQLKFYINRGNKGPVCADLLAGSFGFPSFDLDIQTIVLRGIAEWLPQVPPADNYRYMARMLDEFAHIVKLNSDSESLRLVDLRSGLVRSISANSCHADISAKHVITYENVGFCETDEASATCSHVEDNHIDTGTSRGDFHVFLELWRSNTSSEITPLMDRSCCFDIKHDEQTPLARFNIFEQQSASDSDQFHTKINDRKEPPFLCCQMLQHQHFPDEASFLNAVQQFQEHMTVHNQDNYIYGYIGDVLWRYSVSMNTADKIIQCKDDREELFHFSSTSTHYVCVAYQKYPLSVTGGKNCVTINRTSDVVSDGDTQTQGDDNYFCYITSPSTDVTMSDGASATGGPSYTEITTHTTVSPLVGIVSEFTVRVDLETTQQPLDNTTRTNQIPENGLNSLRKGGVLIEPPPEYIVEVIKMKTFYKFVPFIISLCIVVPLCCLDVWERRFEIED